MKQIKNWLGWRENDIEMQEPVAEQNPEPQFTMDAEGIPLDDQPLITNSNQNIIREKHETTVTERLLLPTQLISTGIAAPVIFYGLKEVENWITPVVAALLGYAQTGFSYWVLDGGLSPLQENTAPILKMAFIGTVNSIYGATNGVFMKVLDKGLEESDFELGETEELNSIELLEAAGKVALLAGGTAVALYGTAKLMSLFGISKIRSNKPTELEEIDSEFSDKRKTMALTSTAFDAL